MFDRRYERLLQRTGDGECKLRKAVRIVKGKESGTHLEVAFPST